MTLTNSTQLSEFDDYLRDRALDSDPAAGLFAVAYTLARLSASIDGLTKAFSPQGLNTFESDYFLVRLSRRLDELSKQLGPALAALTAQLAQQMAPVRDPPEAEEFLSHRRRRPPGRRKIIPNQR